MNYDSTQDHEKMAVATQAEHAARIGAGAPPTHDIGWAVLGMRLGLKVRRAGWNGKGMFLIYVPGTKGVEPRAGTPYADHGFVKVDIEPHIDMFTAQKRFQPGWLCSQADLLATDWEIAE
jgi:hypothetical protein